MNSILKFAELEVQSVCSVPGNKEPVYGCDVNQTRHFSKTEVNLSVRYWGRLYSVTYDVHDAINTLNIKCHSVLRSRCTHHCLIFITRYVCMLVNRTPGANMPKCAGFENVFA